jgi:hypothetical protein
VKAGESIRAENEGTKQPGSADDKHVTAGDSGARDTAGGASF